MKMHPTISRLLSIILIGCLLVTLVPLKALADSFTDHEEQIEYYEDNYQKHVVVVDANFDYHTEYGSITADTPPKDSGLGVAGINAPDTSVTVTGPISANKTGASVYAEGTVAESGDPAKASVILHSVSSGGTGLEVEASKGGIAQGTVQGNTDAHGIGVSVDANGTDASGKSPSTAMAVVSEVSAYGTDGIKVTAEDGGQAGLIGGNITDSAPQAFGAWIKASDTPAAAASAKPDIESLAYDPETGAFLIPEAPEVPEGPVAEDDETSVSLAGVAVDGVAASAGVHVESNGATAQLQVGEKGIAVTEGNPHDRTDSFLANSVKSSNRGSATLNVEGEIKSEANGASIRAESGGWSVVNAGTITAKQEGFDLDNMGGVIMAQADSISSTLNGVDANTGSSDATNFVIIDGDVTSTDENAIHVVNYGGQAMVAVAGSAESKAESSDPSAPTAGLFYSGTGSDSQAVVLVVDTLSGANGVYLDDGSDPSKLDLTVWTIEAPKYENLIAGQDAESFAKTVSYIINVVNPGDGELYAVHADGSALAKKFDNEGQGGFEVANEDQKIILKTDQDHYIKSATNGPGGMTVNLQKDESGNYFYIVPRGGGAWLQAILELVKHAPSAPVKLAPNREKAAIAVELAGGILEGSGDAVSLDAYIGGHLIMPDAPEQEGFRFLGWALTDPDNPDAEPEKLYQPGERVWVTKTYIITAVWEKIG